MNREMRYLEHFNFEINKVVQRLADNDFEEAKRIFNSRLGTRKYLREARKEKSPIAFVSWYLFDLYDYFNKSSWREIGAVTRDDLLRAFTEEYQETLQQSIEKIKSRIDENVYPARRTIILLFIIASICGIFTTMIFLI
jgi:hypothetical protein